MKYDPDDVVVTFTSDKPKSGMFHCGPVPCWVQATHKPTMMTARAYSRNQMRAKESAMMALEFMIDCADAADDSYCIYPEVLESEDRNG